MTAAALDTLKVARDLEAAGVERRQAEAHAEALRQAATAGSDEVVTKDDLWKSLETMEARLDKRISDLRGDIYRALWIQGGALVAIVTALKLFG